MVKESHYDLFEAEDLLAIPINTFSPKMVLIGCARRWRDVVGLAVQEEQWDPSIGQQHDSNTSQ